jgi:L-fuconolactonase
VTENFGPQRMMFGSDWPVSLLGGTYAEVVGIVETITADWSAHEKEALWSSTAIKAYRLGDLLS